MLSLRACMNLIETMRDSQNAGFLLENFHNLFEFESQTLPQIIDSSTPPPGVCTSCYFLYVTLKLMLYFRQKHKYLVQPLYNFNYRPSSYGPFHDFFSPSVSLVSEMPVIESDVKVLALYLYNNTFFHLIILGCIFFVVIMCVI